MIDALGIHGAFWMFGSNCLIAAAFVFLFVPETKGRTLEQIEDLLSTNKGCRQLTLFKSGPENEHSEGQLMPIPHKLPESSLP
jgi:hypothetical protein